MTRAPELSQVEWRQYWALMDSHPEQHMRIADDTIRRYPDDPTAYRDRYYGWANLERLDLALSNIDKVLSLHDDVLDRLLRGALLRRMGRYQEAIDEFQRCEAMNEAIMEIPIYAVERAECHARLGNLEAALADCATLRKGHRQPSFNGGPGGTKSQIIAAIHRIAAEAQQS